MGLDDDIRRDLADKGYEVHEQIGRGAFSIVYRATRNVQDGPPVSVALKCITPTTKASRIANECSHLLAANGSPNVIQLLDYVRHGLNVTLVFPLISHDKFSSFLETSTLEEVAAYMRCMMSALAHIHERGVIHRDVKPRNFLYDRKQQLGVLVDFGLAQQMAQVAEAAAQRKSKSPDRFQPGRRASQMVSGAPVPHPAKRPRVSAAALEGPAASSRAVGISEDAGVSVSVGGTAAAGGASAHLLSHTPSPPQRSPQTTGLDVLGLTSGGASAPVSGITSRRRIAAGLPLARSMARQHSVLSQWGGLLKQRADRAGTPGFRAPEVLMAFTHQTTAVDVWSAGVTFAALLMRRYPLFSTTDPDDLASLAQVFRLLGRTSVMAAATALGKRIESNIPFSSKGSLQSLIKQGRRDDVESNADYLASAMELLVKCLDPNPFTRITAAEALKHPFLAAPPPPASPPLSPPLSPPIF